MSDEVTSPPRSGAVAPHLVRCCAWLTLAVIAAWAPVAWYGNHTHGADGILTATLAALVCLGGSTAALILSALTHGPQAAMLRLAGGMALRMGVPLVAGVLLSQFPRLSGSGVFGMVVVFYLVALAVETPLSLRFIQDQPAGALAAPRQERV